ncbi:MULTISPECIES: hypothetical protein [Bacillus cereus group]|uniref:hypothetical protein n=1 Tax=Bacillus cereus group TaxID=86661 RepID=UPI000BF858DF|nr:MULTISPECIES: hypothetical protein [Bacillus cereus group]PFY77135.1 hypothetical protein COL61_05325 [Bacillus wiedmannii]PYD99992.1 hypothetical protein CR195_003350 [Bacillus cereus]
MDAAEGKEYYQPLVSSSLSYAQRNAELEKRILNALCHSYEVPYEIIKQVKEIATKSVTEETKLKNLEKLFRDHLYQKGGFFDEV